MSNNDFDIIKKINKDKDDDDDPPYEELPIDEEPQSIYERISNLSPLDIFDNFIGIGEGSIPFFTAGAYLFPTYAPLFASIIVAIQGGRKTSDIIKEYRQRFTGVEEEEEEKG